MSVISKGVLPVVTDNGRPVVKVVPLRVRASAAEVFGDVRGRVVYRGHPCNDHRRVVLGLAGRFAFAALPGYPSLDV